MSLSCSLSPFGYQNRKRSGAWWKVTLFLEELVNSITNEIITLQYNICNDLILLYITSLQVLCTLVKKRMWKAQGRRSEKVQTGWPLRLLPTQIVLWFSDSLILVCVHSARICFSQIPSTSLTEQQIKAEMGWNTQRGGLCITPLCFCREEGQAAV